MYILFRKIEIFRKLPKLCTAVPEGTAEILRCEIMLCRPAVRPILTASHQFIGTVYLMQGTGGGVSQFVIANAPQKPGGANFGKVQKDCQVTLVPHRCPRLGTAYIPLLVQ